MQWPVLAEAHVFKQSVEPETFGKGGEGSAHVFSSIKEVWVDPGVGASL